MQCSRLTLDSIGTQFCGQVIRDRKSSLQNILLDLEKELIPGRDEFGKLGKELFRLRQFD